MRAPFVRGKARPGLATRALAIAASLIVHVTALLLWRVDPPVHFGVVQPSSTLPETIRFALEPVAPARKIRVARPATPSQHVNPPQAPQAQAAVESPRDSSAGAIAAQPVQPAAAPLAHGFGDGRLWVSPLSSQELDLTHRLKKGYAEQADSAVRVMIQAYLDSMAIQLARGPKPPTWVGEVGGRKFGVDSRFVYVAGLKIPTFLLALLPFPAGGNQSLAFDRSGQMYDDLRRAAVRSANLEEFKSAIKALREASEFQHQLRAAQRDDAGPEEGPVAGSSP